jgi:thymidylate synthase (FAD)
MDKLSPEYIDHSWVLDKGECALLGVFGDDKMIADTARVSYRKGTKQTSTDKQLIRYLIRHKHTSPLEHATLRFYIKAPLFVIQQLLRHRTFKFNQASARYSEMLNEAYIPLPEHITTQDAKNKQARTTTQVPYANRLVAIMQGESERAFNQYNSYLEDGVARELARVNVPHGTYSELIMTCDLHNLLHFLQLRLSPHAQYEIRVYAEAIYEFVKGCFPAATEAWEDCQLRSITLTGMMQEALGAIFQEWSDERYKAGGDDTSSASHSRHLQFSEVVHLVCNRFSWPSISERTEFEFWVLKNCG